MTYAPHKTSRILAGLLIGVCTVMIGLFLLIHMRQNAKQQIEVALRNLSLHATLPVQVKNWRLGLTSVTFENIAIGKNQEAVLSRVDAAINLSPFSGDFGKLKSVSVDRIRIKSEISSATEVLRLLQSKFTGQQASLTPPNLQTESKLFSRLPFSDELTIKSAGVRIIDPFGRDRLRIRGLSLHIHVEEQKALFRAGYLSSPDGLLERDLVGQLNVTPGQKGYQFRLGSKSHRSADWAIRGRLNDTLNSFTMQVDSRTLPRFLEPHLRNYVAKPELLKTSAKISGQKNDASGWAFGIDAKVSGIRLAHSLISKQVVGPIALQLGTKGVWSGDDNHFTLQKGLISIVSNEKPIDPPLKLFFSGGSRLSRLDGQHELFGTLRLPPTSCQQLIDTPPANFAPDIQEMQLAGSIQGAVEFNLPLHRPHEFFYRLFATKFSCDVVATPHAFGREHLKAAFSVYKSFKDKKIKVAIDPLSESYSALSDIANHVPKAFVISEDASYWKHDGIDGQAIEAAFRRNLGEGQVAMGGSTITMQTVKNLFLSHERTLSRKYQEVILAWHMNRALSKERILEIYMNLVEFGPGIYGITKAAEHYFAKHPFDLSLKESTFLANMLPSPVRRHRHFCSGKGTPEFEDLIDRLLRRMLNLRRISHHEYVHALRTPLQFNAEARANSPHCKDDLARSADGAG